MSIDLEIKHTPIASSNEDGGLVRHDRLVKERRYKCRRDCRILERWVAVRAPMCQLLSVKYETPLAKSRLIAALHMYYSARNDYISNQQDTSSL